MLQRMRERFKNEKGLTLVELLAVIVILAIVGAIAFVMIGNIIENSKKDAHVANALQLIESAKLYEANGKSIDGELKSSDLQGEELLGEFIDPWEKSKYSSDGVVTKSGAVYSVALDDENSKCKIDTVSEAKLIKHGRDACGNSDSDLD